MLNSNLYTEKQDLLITPHLAEGQLPTFLEQALSISSTDSNDCSTKQEAVKQAKVLGVGLKSLDRWLAKFVQTDDLQHISHGIYRKRIYQTA